MDHIRGDAAGGQPQPEEGVHRAGWSTGGGGHIPEAAALAAASPQVALLRTRMLGLVNSFQKHEPNNLLGLMQILGDTLHRVGPQGMGACSLKLAQRLRQLFENVSPRTRHARTRHARTRVRAPAQLLSQPPHTPTQGLCVKSLLEKAPVGTWELHFISAKLMTFTGRQNLNK